MGQRPICGDDRGKSLHRRCVHRLRLRVRRSPPSPVEAGRITKAEGACNLAEPWLLGQDAPAPGGRNRRSARHAWNKPSNGPPPFCGQSGTADLRPVGQQHRRAAGRLPAGRPNRRRDRHHRFAMPCPFDPGGASRRRIDLLARRSEEPLRPGRVLGIQSAGQPSPAPGALFGRSRGMFLPRGRADRTLVVVDVQPTATSAAADEFIPVERAAISKPSGRCGRCWAASSQTLIESWVLPSIACAGWPSE